MILKGHGRVPRTQSVGVRDLRGRAQNALLLIGDDSLGPAERLGLPRFDPRALAVGVRHEETENKVVARLSGDVLISWSTSRCSFGRRAGSSQGSDSRRLRRGRNVRAFCDNLFKV